MSSTPLRKPLDQFSVGLMLLLTMIWGFQQVAIKLGSPDMTAPLQIGVRSLIAFILLTGFLLYQRTSLSFKDGTLKAGILVAIIFAVDFLAVGYGLLYTTASHMTVFLYTAPLFTALGLHFLIKEERLNRMQWTGLAIAFVGIAIAFSEGLMNADANLLKGDLLGIFAGICWAGSTITIRKTKLAEAPPTKTLWYQTAGAAVLILTLNFQHLPEVNWTPELMINLAFQSVIISFASFLAWLALLRRYLASRLSAFSFLTPIWGVAFGVLLLGETLDPRFIAGAVLVLIGIALVNKKQAIITQ